MIKTDEDALMCDLAETYHIYDFRQLPLQKAAVFSCGLRENSRIKMKLSNHLVSLDTLILAGLSDQLGLLLWSKTKDGQKGVNHPVGITNTLIVQDTSEKNELVFTSGEDFEKARTALLDGIELGGDS